MIRPPPLRPPTPLTIIPLRFSVWTARNNTIPVVSKRRCFSRLFNLCKCQSASVPPLYGLVRSNFGAASGFIFCGVLEDWVAGDARFGPAVFHDKRTDQVIEGGSEILKDFTGSQGYFDGDFMPLLETEHPLRSPRVYVADDFIWVIVSEEDKTLFEITNVLFGPFDFFFDAIDARHTTMKHTAKSTV